MAVPFLKNTPAVQETNLVALPTSPEKRRVATAGLVDDARPASKLSRSVTEPYSADAIAESKPTRSSWFAYRQPLQ